MASAGDPACHPQSHLNQNGTFLPSPFKQPVQLKTEQFLSEVSQKSFRRLKPGSALPFCVQGCASAPLKHPAGIHVNMRQRHPGSHGTDPHPEQNQQGHRCRDRRDERTSHQASPMPSGHQLGGDSREGSGQGHTGCFPFFLAELQPTAGSNLCAEPFSAKGIS